MMYSLCDGIKVLVNKAKPNWIWIWSLSSHLLTYLQSISEPYHIRVVRDTFLNYPKTEVAYLGTHYAEHMHTLVPHWCFWYCNVLIVPDFWLIWGVLDLPLFLLQELLNINFVELSYLRWYECCVNFGKQLKVIKLNCVLYIQVLIHNSIDRYLFFFKYFMQTNYLEPIHWQWIYNRDHQDNSVTQWIMSGRGTHYSLHCLQWLGYTYMRMLARVLRVQIGVVGSSSWLRDSSLVYSIFFESKPECDSDASTIVRFPLFLSLLTFLTYLDRNWVASCVAPISRIVISLGYLQGLDSISSIK